MSFLDYWNSIKSDQIKSDQILFDRIGYRLKSKNINFEINGKK